MGRAVARARRITFKSLQRSTDPAGFYRLVNLKVTLSL
jgi:hypothetical protein